jgi:hypothetical protein
MEYYWMFILMTFILFTVAALSTDTLRDVSIVLGLLNILLSLYMKQISLKEHNSKPTDKTSLRNYPMSLQDASDNTGAEMFTNQMYHNNPFSVYENAEMALSEDSMAGFVGSPNSGSLIMPSNSVCVGMKRMNRMKGKQRDQGVQKSRMIGSNIGPEIINRSKTYMGDQYIPPRYSEPTKAEMDYEYDAGVVKPYISVAMREAVEKMKNRLTTSGDNDNSGKSGPSTDASNREYSSPHADSFSGGYATEKDNRMNLPNKYSKYAQGEEYENYIASVDQIDNTNGLYGSDLQEQRMARRGQTTFDQSKLAMDKWRNRYNKDYFLQRRTLNPNTMGKYFQREQDSWERATWWGNY